METKSKMETVADDYFRLLDRIVSASSKCRRVSHLIPKEVWLGPKEREIFAARILFEELYKGKLDISMDEILLGLKVSTIYGFNIRFAEEDGVRVGVSFPDNEV